MQTTNSWLTSSDFSVLAKPLQQSVLSKYDDLIKPNVLEAQQFDLRIFLGKDFYADIALTLDAGGTVHGNSRISQSSYDALVPYIKPILVYWAISRFYRQDPNAFISNYGLRTKKEAHSDPVSVKRIEFLSNEETRKGASYAEDLTDYLNENASLYPDWGSESRDNTPSQAFQVSGIRRTRPNPLNDIR